MTKILITRSELGAGTRGSSLGPDSILIESVNNKSKLFTQNQIFNSEVNNNAYFDYDPSTTVKNIAPLIENYKNAKSLTTKQAETGENIIFLSSDHSNAVPHISGVVNANKGKKVGILWIDAHSDLHTPYTTPSGNIHGMPLAILLGEDNIENKQNELTQKEKDYWNQLKREYTSINYQDIFYVGIRAIEKEEHTLISKHNIPILTTNQLNNGIQDVNIDRINKFFKNHDHIYISFDIDALDPDDTSYGTGTPEKYGILKQKFFDFIIPLLDNPKIKYFELVEINPILDNQNILAKLSIELLDIVNKKFAN